MQRLAEVCIARPVFATMLTVALVVIGIVGHEKLGVDRFPAVDLPSVRVQTRLPGAAPEEVETEVSEIVEEAVNTVEGIQELRSISGPGTSIVIATFGLGRDIETAAQDVRDKVAGVVRNLPDDVDPPAVSKVDADSSPVITIAVSGPRSVRELTEIADKTVKVALERSGGVGEVRLVGGSVRTMNVWLDADRLAAYDLPVTAVRDALVAQNANTPGGNVTSEDREESLRTMGRLPDARGFDELVIATVDGVPIRVSDIGRAEDGVAERRTAARLDGEPTVVLEVIRQSGASSIDVIDGVKASLARLGNEIPGDIRLVVIRDQSHYIRAALAEINKHLLLGSVLASLVVLLFMKSWRSTLIACVAIPTSLVATFAAMWWLGFTMNSVTMLALVLMVGIVIDDAIVVLENVFRFVEEKGMPPREAAREATREIGLAVLATTLSLVVIFVPVSFMSSIAGRFLYQFGITSAVAILVSLFISFSLTPMMASRILRSADAGKGHGETHGGASSRRGFYGLIERAYGASLAWSMRHRWIVALVSIAAIAASVPLLQRTRQEFVPTDVDEAEFQVSVNAPEGTSLDAMDRAMELVEDAVRTTPGVRTVLSTTGGGFLGGVNSSNVHVQVAPHGERTLSFTRLWEATLRGSPGEAFRGNYTQADVMTEVDRRLKRLAPLRCQVRNYPSFNIGGGSWDVDFVLQGPVLEDLQRYAEEIRKRGMAHGGFRGLDTTLRLDKPELRVTIDRERAADLGLRARDVGTAMRLLVGGDDEVSRFRDPLAGEDYDVRLRLEPEDRERADLLDLLRVPRAGGDPVELSSVASVVPGRAPSRIDRLDRRRIVSVRGGVAAGAALGDQVEALRSIAADLKMPPEYSTRLLGRSREMERTFDEFLWAFVLSVVFMYLILASQFESLIHPLTILLSLPLSIPFALLSLEAGGGTLNLFSALGILVLFGVVKKNSILQIDHMNGLRAKGLPRLEAILQANRDRLRPILMTTLALVAGMLPLALGTGPGAEERRAVAIVVIGGQTLCLLLTLLATPVAYSLFDDAAAWLRTEAERRRIGGAGGAGHRGAAARGVRRGIPGNPATPPASNGSMRTGLVVGSGAAVVAVLGTTAFLLSTCGSYRTEVHRPPDDPAEALVDDRLADKAPQPFDPARVYDVPCGKDGAWVQNRSEAVLRLDVPMVRPDTDREQLVLHPSYADAVRANRTGRPVLPSINAIDGKAKQFDDGLVAALDLACFDGIEGKLVGRVEIVQRIHDLVRIKTGRSEPFLAAALELAGKPVQKPDAAAVREWIDRFEANETLSKPIGIHTWNERLTRVFRFTRFLQQEFGPGEFPDASRVAVALEGSLEAYERTLAIDRGVHNPPACGSLLDLEGARRVAVLPRSSSRELELIGRLFPRGLPAGTNLMSELVRRIRSGEVDLAPRPDGGWLDRQVFALETLLLPERADERDKLLLTKAYKKRMLEAFQALLVKRLETHAMAVGEAASARPAPVSVEPTLRVEPCATYALRTARAYAFLEAFLVATLGEDALRSMRGLREGGDRGADLLTELRSMRDLFYGIHLVSADDVGMLPTIAADEPVDRAACRAAALAWLAKAYEDADLAVDTRVSIPVWEDAGQTRLWATLGVRTTRLDVSWAKRPRIRPADGSEDWREAPWGSISYAIPVDDFAEITLGADRSLSREELRAACGTGRTREEILRSFE